jgi:transposase
MTNKTIELPLDLTFRELATRYILAVVEAQEGKLVKVAASMDISMGTAYKWLRASIPESPRPMCGPKRKKYPPSPTETTDTAVA